MARRYRDAGCTLLTVTADVAAIARDTAAQLGRARVSA
jgi:2-keto-3-deoxy-L-rhamnonate aldolase RhmA